MSSEELVLILKWLCNTVLHQCVAVVMVYGIWNPIINYDGGNSWHAILCTLGIFPFMSEAMILFYDTNVCTQGLTSSMKRGLHAILMSIGSVLIIAGIAIKIDTQDGGHFGTAHGVVGLITLIIFIFSVISGPLPLADVLKFTIPLPWRKLTHNVLGQLGLVMTVASLCTGFYSESFSEYTSHQSRLAATLLVCFVGIFCCVTSIKSEIEQIKLLVY